MWRPLGSFVGSVLVIVAHCVFFCFDSCFREYRDHTDSSAIPVGECGVI